MKENKPCPAIILEDDPGYLDIEADMVNRWLGGKQFKRHRTSENCVRCRENKPAKSMSTCSKCRNQQPNYKYSDYKDRSLKRGIEFLLSKEQFMAFWRKPCYYCGYKIKTIGLDRVDNSKGYELGNIVACCALCNQAKSDMPQDQFIFQCSLVARNHHLVGYGERSSTHLAHLPATCPTYPQKQAQAKPLPYI